jgi:hypothetical protein
MSGVITMRFDSPSNVGFRNCTTTAELDFDDLNPATQPQPTEGQMKFVTDLRAAWQEAEDEIARLTGREARHPAWVDPASREEASTMIDRGKDARDTIRAELREARRAHRVAGRTEVTEGMWIVGEIIEGMTPEIYKVQIAHHGSGRPYAKRLYADGFDYDRGGIRRIAEAGRKMTLDEAKSYGVCCRCGAVLTDERSIEAGIGPVCASKF